MQSLRVEALKGFRGDDRFQQLDYQGVKIFVKKGLQVATNATVFQRLRIPFLPPLLGAEGIY